MAYGGPHWGMIFGTVAVRWLVFVHRFSVDKKHCQAGQEKSIPGVQPEINVNIWRVVTAAIPAGIRHAAIPYLRNSLTEMNPVAPSPGTPPTAQP